MISHLSAGNYTTCINIYCFVFLFFLFFGGGGLHIFRITLYDVRVFFLKRARSWSSTGIAGWQTVELQIIHIKTKNLLRKKVMSAIGLINPNNKYNLWNFQYQNISETFYFRRHYFTCLRVFFKHSHQPRKANYINGVSC